MSVPPDSGSVVFFSVSKDDLAEAPQTVTFDWVSPQQTVVEPAPAQTVVVEPEGPTPVFTPTPTPTPISTSQDDASGDGDDGTAAGGDAQTSIVVPDADTVAASDPGGNALDDTSDDASGDGQVTAQQGSTIPPIDINVTVRQPQDQAGLGATVGAAPGDNTEPAPLSSQGGHVTALFVSGAGGKPSTISKVLLGIWNFISAIAHLMFI